MNYLNLLILFLPAIGWGLMPLAIASVKNSTVYNQIVGTVVAAFLFAVIVMLIAHPALNWPLFLFSALAGACWVVGQVGQYISYSRISVSATMPISTGLQLIGVPLVGVIAFHEWQTTQSKLWGFFGIIVLIIGVIFTSRSDEGTSEGSSRNQWGTLILLILTTFGYIASSSIPKALHGSSISIFFGETVGMMISVFIYTLVTGNLKAWAQKTTVLSGSAGILYGIANLAYIYSIGPWGVNTAFVVSQLCVVISTLGGLLFLHEKKSKRGLIYTLIGLVLIVIGAFLTTVIK